MTIREYAIAVGDEVSERFETDVQVSIFEKEVPNGKLTGLTVKEEDKLVAPTIYINDLYDKDVRIEEAAEKVISRYKSAPPMQADVNLIKDWNYAKEHLTARLYPGTMDMPVSISAEQFGFDDLIIVPYVDININKDNKGAAIVNSGLIEIWEQSVDEVIKVALENVKRNAKVMDLTDYLNKLSGTSSEVFNKKLGIDIITTNEMAFGAIAVIAIKDELKKKYPAGYSVIPSSVHEVLVLPNELAETIPLDMFIWEVNEQEVAPHEQLGNRHYKIA